MDESGCLGFYKNSSKYFTVSFLFVVDKKPVEKMVKNIFRSLSKRSIKISWWVLYATKEKEATIKKLLKKCSELDIQIMSIVLDKTKVYTRLYDKKHELYNYIINILLWRLIEKWILPTWIPITFVASRRETSVYLNQNFTDYIHNALVEHPYDISVHIKKPSQEKCLQVIDFISWSTFQKYEHENSSYIDILTDKIIEERWLFG